MTYHYDQRPNTSFSENTPDAIKAIKSSEYSVLVGRNNCGKSFLLKTITQELGEKASYLGPARYQNFNLLGHFSPNRNSRQQKYQQFLQQWHNQQQNFDNSPLNLQQAIAELSDTKRANLTSIIRLLLGSSMDILFTVPDNSMSQKYISCDGHNMSYTSSGYRLITAILTSLLDNSYDTFLIDEPELGISPEAQGILADFLFDKEHRQTYFPHIKTLMFATHSTIFLDRSNIRNNFMIIKRGDVIDVNQVQCLTDFNRIHFFLLGNRFETLYLPSAIILVEGISDYLFISRVLEVQFPGTQFSIINANSDSRMKDIINTARTLFSDFQKSPYRGRIIPVLDSTHGQDIVSSFKSMGIPDNNIVIWEKNGIEHYYPASVLDKVFGAGGEITIQEDTVERNGVKYKKAELADKVVKLVDSTVQYLPEFDNKLLNRIEAVTGVRRSQVQ